MREIHIRFEDKLWTVTVGKLSIDFLLRKHAMHYIKTTMKRWENGE